MNSLFSFSMYIKTYTEAICLTNYLIFRILFDQAKCCKRIQQRAGKRMKMRMGRRMNAVAMIPDWLVSAQTREGGLFRTTRFLVSLFDQAKREEMKRMKMRM
jgi:hypothetical protein